MGVGLVQFDASLDPRAPKDAARTYRLATEAIDLPPARSWALGNRISSASIEGTLAGPVDDPVPPSRDLAARAAAWRDGGGELTIRDMAMGWGPLGLSGAGTLGLDERLQPTWNGQVRAIGYAAALDALVSAHALTPGAATAAKAVLSLLAHVPQDGSPPDVEVPLTLHDRVLSMSQFPLLRVPELIWP
jgi:hypothetical protein